MLIGWFDAHVSTPQGPYPTASDKNFLSRKTGLKIEQVEHFFANARRVSRNYWTVKERANVRRLRRQKNEKKGF